MILVRLKRRIKSQRIRNLYACAFPGHIVTSLKDVSHCQTCVLPDPFMGHGNETEQKRQQGRLCFNDYITRNLRVEVQLRRYRQLILLYTNTT